MALSWCQHYSSSVHVPARHVSSTSWAINATVGRALAPSLCECTSPQRSHMDAATVACHGLVGMRSRWQHCISLYQGTRVIKGRQQQVPQQAAHLDRPAGVADQQASLGAAVARSLCLGHWCRVELVGDAGHVVEEGAGASAWCWGWHGGRLRRWAWRWWRVGRAGGDCRGHV